MLPSPPIGSDERIFWEDKPEYWDFILRIKWSLPVAWIMCLAFGFAAWQLWWARPIRDVQGNIWPSWIVLAPLLASWIFGYIGFLRPYIAHRDWSNTRYVLTNKAVYVSFGVLMPRWRAWPLASLKPGRITSVRTRGGRKIGCILFDKGRLRFSNSMAYWGLVRLYEGWPFFPRALLYVHDPDRVLELITQTRIE